MDYYLIVYILFSIVLIFSGVYLFMKQNKTTALILYLLGSIAVCTFYGMRWFSNGSSLNSLGYTGQWPPASKINMCPDFFTLYTGSGGKTYCVDYVGFSTSSTPLAVFPTAPSPTLREVIPASGGNFTIATGASGNNAVAVSSLSTPALRCSFCQAAGVTWEGVYDGQNCSTSVIGGGSGAAKKCAD